MILVLIQIPLILEFPFSEQRCVCFSYKPFPYAACRIFEANDLDIRKPEERKQDQGANDNLPKVSPPDEELQAGCPAGGASLPGPVQFYSVPLLPFRFSLYWAVVEIHHI